MQRPVLVLLCQNYIMPGMAILDSKLKVDRTVQDKNGGNIRPIFSF